MTGAENEDENEEEEEKRRIGEGLPIGARSKMQREARGLSLLEQMAAWQVGLQSAEASDESESARERHRRGPPGQEAQHEKRKRTYIQPK